MSLFCHVSLPFSPQDKEHRQSWVQNFEPSPNTCNHSLYLSFVHKWGGSIKKIPWKQCFKYCSTILVLASKVKISNLEKKIKHKEGFWLNTTILITKGEGEKLILFVLCQLRRQKHFETFEARFRVFWRILNRKNKLARKDTCQII